jgi:8-oxo-dGTP diphosphatase
MPLDLQSEADFLKAYDQNQFDRPSITVDLVVITVIERRLQILCTKRTDHPFKDLWALPGGFVRMEESLDQAALRVLQQKTGLAQVYLEQLYTFGEVQRDPRMRIVSVAYYALVEHQRIQPLIPGAALLAIQESSSTLPTLGHEGQSYPLAFDHAAIVATCLQRLRGKLEYSPIAFGLLPKLFTLRQLQEVHETILGHKLNKDSFRRKVLASGKLESTGQTEQGKDFRPAELYGLRSS